MHNMRSYAFIFVLLISFLSLLQDGTSQTFFIGNATHRDHPGKCYHDFSPPVVVLRKGEKKRLTKQCLYVECKKGYLIQGAGCGVPGGGVHCRTIKGDLSKPYPYCCDEFIC